MHQKNKYKKGQRKRHQTRSNKILKSMTLKAISKDGNLHLQASNEIEPENVYNKQNQKPPKSKGKQDK